MAYEGIVYGFRHDWGEPVRERLAWLTDVIAKKRGREQRPSLRAHPRRTLLYKPALITRAERVAFDEFLFAYQDEEMLVPVFPYQARLAADLASGETVVPFDTAGMDFDAGAYLIFYRGFDQFEAVEIDSVADGEITLAEATASAWARGTRVFPARLGRLAERVSGVKITRAFERAEAEFEILQPSTRRFAGATPSQFKSLDFYGQYTQGQGRDRAVETSRRRGRVDFATGASVTVSRDDGPTISVAHERKLAGYDEVADFLCFLSRRRGRAVPFWHPTFEQDFSMTVLNPQSPVTYLTVEQEPVGGQGYAARFAAGKARRYLCLRAGTIENPNQSFAIGDLVPVRVHGAEDNLDGTETLTVDYFGAHIYNTAAVFSHTSYLRYCRLESDAVELSWRSTGRANVRLGFHELTKEVPAF